MGQATQRKNHGCGRQLLDFILQVKIASIHFIGVRLILGRQTFYRVGDLAIDQAGIIVTMTGYRLTRKTKLVQGFE